MMSDILCTVHHIIQNVHFLFDTIDTKYQNSIFFSILLHYFISDNYMSKAITDVVHNVKSALFHRVPSTVQEGFISLLLQYEISRGSV